MSEEFVKSVKTLLATGKGDTARLREILESVKQNNPVYMSDYKYIQNLATNQTDDDKKDDPNDFIAPKLEDPLDLLRVRLAEGKISIAEFRELKKTLKEF